MPTVGSWFELKPEVESMANYNPQNTLENAVSQKIWSLCKF